MGPDLNPNFNANQLTGREIFWKLALPILLTNRPTTRGADNNLPTTWGPNPNRPTKSGTNPHPDPSRPKTRGPHSNHPMRRDFFLNDTNPYLWP